MRREVSVLLVGDGDGMHGPPVRSDDRAGCAVLVAGDEVQRRDAAVDGRARGGADVRIVASGAEQPDLGRIEPVVVEHALHRGGDRRGA